MFRFPTMIFKVMQARFLARLQFIVDVCASEALRATCLATAFLAVAIALGWSGSLTGKEPVPFIFDTDIGNDVDDVLALGMIHSLESRGELKLVAVTLTKDAKEAPAFVDTVNTFYGRVSVPIGITSSGVTPDKGKFLGLAEVRKENGEYRYPHDVTSRDQVESAVLVLRKALASAEDQSVVIAQVGFSTNLSDLLNSAADSVSPLTGKELVAQKVKLLSVMAGAFAPIDGNPGYGEYNVVQDIKSAQNLVRHWPGKIVFSGFEIGIAVPYPAESILKDYQYVVHHPLSESYILYEPPPHNRPTWDLTSVLYAIYPDRGYFGISDAGTVGFTDDGKTKFAASPSGKHHYLTLTDVQKTRVIEALVQLSSQPPQHRISDHQSRQ
jgi:purine nucleosidase